MVIAHLKNPTADLTTENLRRFYLGRSTAFPSREPVILVESPSLRDRFYERALGMNADRFKRHWIGVVFAGESSAPPKEVGNADGVLQFVASHPGALAFVELSAVNSSVKVLSIDGLRPTDSGYRLK